MAEKKERPAQEPVPAGFVDLTDYVDELMEEPGMKTAVANIDRGVEEMDRVYAEGLAEIRKAAHMTQVDLARQLGVTQAAVSRLENREDILLSTLADFAAGLGAVQGRIVFQINGREVELPLDRYHVLGKA